MVDFGEEGGFFGLQRDDQSLWKLSPQIFSFLDDLGVLEQHVRTECLETAPTSTLSLHRIKMTLNEILDSHKTFEQKS